MHRLGTYQGYRHDNKYEIDGHVSDCVREKHPESIHAILLEYPKRTPISFKVLAASRGNRNEESHTP